MPEQPARPLIIFIGIGLVAGFLSGLFGVGGGILIVPALMMLAHFPQKLAAGTSLGAIVPMASVGVISYSISGSVDVIAAAALAVGGIFGVMIGARLLHRIPRTALRWMFIGFLAVVIVSLFLVIPSRGVGLELHVWTIVALLALGVVTGVLSGLLGIGGGVVVVPMLMLLFGSSDLIAKGTSLLMMIPTAISGSITNFRRDNIDIRAALTVGISAVTTTALGAWLAQSISPQAANIAFAIFLVLIAVRMAFEGRAKK